MARRLQQAGRGRLVALEHAPEYARATRVEIAAYGLEDYATVLDAPLVDHVIEDEKWSWYELGPDVPGEVDLLLVDGPPGTTVALARYPALPLLRDRLAPGAVVLLDDGDRDDERKIVQRWKAELGGVEPVYLPLGKGAWSLTMPR
jgi:predicted O-methyltransferase YrrM